MTISERKAIHLRQLLTLGVLWVFVLVSAIAVVYQVHSARVKFNEIEILRVDRQALEGQWSQYILEVSAWASFDRVESVATTRLMMQVPTTEQRVMVKLGGNEQ